MECLEHIQPQLSDRCFCSEFWISVALSSRDDFSYFLFLRLEDQGKKDERGGAQTLPSSGQQGARLLCVHRALAGPVHITSMLP